MRDLYHGSKDRIVTPKFGLGKRNNDYGLGFYAYDKAYLLGAKKNLGRMMDFAVHEMGYSASEFWELFLTSGVADAFGSGESHLLGGMSGIELAYEVLDRAKRKYRRVKDPICAAEKSPEYWAGWALAHYQWQRGLSFAEIDHVASFDDVVRMYSPYHEMDVSQFVDEIDRLYRSLYPLTNLRRARERAGFSQSELAEYAGVSVRTIQEFEQRRKNINKAQVDTVYPLARALYTTVEALIERIP